VVAGGATARTRLDQLLVDRGLVDSRARAQALVRAGVVRVGGRRADRTDERVEAGADVEVATGPRYVGRGGDKLAGAIEDLGLAVAGRTALDAGASTGGFTDALLQNGAAHVYAVDVGYGQLDWRLRQDPRVSVLERTNIRELKSLPGPAPDLVAADLSFISLRTVLPAISRLATAGAELVLLFKPQFEVGRGRVGRGGVVRDETVREEALRDFLSWAATAGYVALGEAQSRIQGAKGNQETFVRLRNPAAVTEK
jgi:23S rRNA (cytidine1920-2'-O)/16S rRNA (cytidine1409-2'-O)-methyltransferase